MVSGVQDHSEPSHPLLILVYEWGVSSNTGYKKCRQGVSAVYGVCRAFTNTKLFSSRFFVHPILSLSEVDPVSGSLASLTSCLFAMISQCYLWYLMLYRHTYH